MLGVVLKLTSLAVFGHHGRPGRPGAPSADKETVERPPPLQHQQQSRCLDPDFEAPGLLTALLSRELGHCRLVHVSNVSSVGTCYVPTLSWCWRCMVDQTEIPSASSIPVQGQSNGQNTQSNTEQGVLRPHWRETEQTKETSSWGDRACPPPTHSHSAHPPL